MTVHATVVQENIDEQPVRFVFTLWDDSEKITQKILMHGVDGFPSADMTIYGVKVSPSGDCAVLAVGGENSSGEQITKLIALWRDGSMYIASAPNSTFGPLSNSITIDNHNVLYDDEFTWRYLPRTTECVPWQLLDPPYTAPTYGEDGPGPGDVVYVETTLLGYGLTAYAAASGTLWVYTEEVVLDENRNPVVSAYAQAVDIPSQKLLPRRVKLPGTGVFGRRLYLSPDESLIGCMLYDYDAQHYDVRIIDVSSNETVATVQASPTSFVYFGHESAIVLAMDNVVDNLGTMTWNAEATIVSLGDWRTTTVSSTLEYLSPAWTRYGVNPSFRNGLANSYALSPIQYAETSHHDSGGDERIGTFAHGFSLLTGRPAGIPGPRADDLRFPSGYTGTASRWSELVACGSQPIYPRKSTFWTNLRYAAEQTG